MKYSDVTIYGNLTYDNIWTNGVNTTSVGAMGNVWKHLKLINRDLNVNLEPTDIGESLIVAETKQCKRTSVSNMSLRTRVPNTPGTDINHIMYLNEISDLSFIKKLCGIVVADTCNGRPLYQIPHSIISMIDILLISDEDVSSFPEELLYSTNHGIVVHSKCGSRVYNKTGEHSITARQIPNINVLGSGDRLAAYIIDNITTHGLDVPLEHIVQSAHDSLSDFYDKKV